MELPLNSRVERIFLPPLRPANEGTFVLLSPHVNAAGGTVCVRCGLLIRPNDKCRPGSWRQRAAGVYAGAAHAECNRAAGGRAAKRETLEDDPAPGIFWGPPSVPDGPSQRWSRAWFDWRKGSD